MAYDADVMLHILQAMIKKDARPAISWLEKYAPNEDDLIFDLERQEFIRLLRKGYSCHFATFTSIFLQSLMHSMKCKNNGWKIFFSCCKYFLNK